MISTDPNATPIDTSELPLFDGFPYLTTRIVPALYHITLLPADTPETTLLELAQAQASANRLDTCLVLHPRLAVFFWPDGRVTRTDTPPRGGALLSNRLALPVDLRQSRELSERQLRLDRIVAHGQKTGGHIIGNLSKGGHRATAAELEQLRGRGSERAPHGLERCTECDDWRGVCLDSLRDLRWNGDDSALPVRKPQPLRPVRCAALRSPPQRKLLRSARPQHLARARVLRPGPHVQRHGRASRV